MMTMKCLLVAMLGISSASAAITGYGSVGYFGTNPILVGSNGDAMLLKQPFGSSTNIGSINYKFDVAMDNNNKQYWAIWRPVQLASILDYQLIRMEAFTNNSPGVQHTDTFNPAIRVQANDIIGIHMENSASPAPLPYVDSASLSSGCFSCYSSGNLVQYAKQTITGTSLSVGSIWNMAIPANQFSPTSDKRFPTIELFP